MLAEVPLRAPQCSNHLRHISAVVQLASFGFGSPTALLCFQCALAAILVKLCELVGFVKLQPLKPDLVAVWFPVNLIFVG